MGQTEAKFFMWAADKLFDLADLDKSRAEDCRRRVASYFERIAECLSRIAQELRENRVPREEGHFLEGLIYGFDFVLASNFYGKPTLGHKDSGEWRSDLEQVAQNAAVADIYVVRGKPHIGKAPMEKHIQEIEREAGRFRGLAALLETIGPFSTNRKRKV